MFGPLLLVWSQCKVGVAAPRRRFWGDSGLTRGIDPHPYNCAAFRCIQSSHWLPITWEHPLQRCETHPISAHV
jgi:hypothetical protein